eukprot:2993944-Pleurochrysis_carterae.AAC.1
MAWAQSGSLALASAYASPSLCARVCDARAGAPLSTQTSVVERVRTRAQRTKVDRSRTNCSTRRIMPQARMLE